MFGKVRCLGVYRQMMCRIGDLLARPKLLGWTAYVVCVCIKVNWDTLSSCLWLSLLIKCYVDCRVSSIECRLHALLFLVGLPKWGPALRALYLRGLAVRRLKQLGWRSSN